MKDMDTATYTAEQAIAVVTSVAAGRTGTMAEAVEDAPKALVHLQSLGFTLAGAAEVEHLREVIANGLEAFRLTREYVDPTGELLPPIEGWSWFDWTQKAAAALSPERA